MGKVAFLVPIMLASLAGCATPAPVPTPKMPIDLMPGQADGLAPVPLQGWLGQNSASRVSGRNDHLHPHWSGPVNVLMEHLAQRIGWHAVLTYAPLAMPDAAVWNTNAPLVQIVHQINAQIQPLATLRILPGGRTLELTRYDPQWLPPHLSRPAHIIPEQMELFEPPL